MALSPNCGSCIRVNHKYHEMKGKDTPTPLYQRKALKKSAGLVIFVQSVIFRQKVLLGRRGNKWNCEKESTGESISWGLGDCDLCRYRDACTTSVRGTLF